MGRRSRLVETDIVMAVENEAPPEQAVPNRRVARARARAEERERAELKRAERIFELLGGEDDGFEDEDW